MSDSSSSFMGMVRRNITIVLVATIAGALVAGAFTFVRSSSDYTATAVVAVDAVALASYPRLPKVDTILGVESDPAFLAAVAKAGGVSDAAASVNVFGTGNPQDRIKVTFVAADKDAATAGAEAGAKAVVTYASDLGAKTLRSQRGLVEADKKALADFDATAAGDPATRADFRWQLERALAADSDTYDWLKGAYSYDGKVSAKQASKRTALLQAVLAGALAGLFIGVVIAAIRETAARRRLA